MHSWKERVDVTRKRNGNNVVIVHDVVVVVVGLTRVIGDGVTSWNSEFHSVRNLEWRAWPEMSLATCASSRWTRAQFQVAMRE